MSKRNPIVGANTRVIPAASGWVARFNGADFSVLGWALGDDTYGDAGPIVWDPQVNRLAVLGSTSNFTVDGPVPGMALETPVKAADNGE